MSKNLGARVIATVSTEEKAKLAREAGADDVIFYTKQDFEVETKRLTDGKGVHVIYDGVGKSTFDQDLNVLRPRGYLALFGASSGPVPLFDLGKLAQKGSLFITRPTLVHHIASHEELIHRSTDVFNMIGSGKLKLRIEHLYSLPDAQQAHRDFVATNTTGKLLLIP
jgi:NADPH2:quinone reductase